MVRDAGALRRPPGRTSAAGVRGDENARPGSPAAPRPPLRAIQQPASGAPRCLVPTARKVWGVRPSKALAPAGTVRASLPLAPRKPGAKLPSKPGLSIAGTSSVEEPRYKIKDAISFWEENHSNGKNVSSKLQQYDSHAPDMIENSADERLTRYSEDIFKLQLELEILKTIFVEEITAHAGIKETTGLDDELKAANLRVLEATRQKEAMESELNKARSVIEALESQLIISINESDVLKETNEQILGLLKKRDKEISSLNSELDMYRGKEEAPLSTKLKRDQASHEKACKINTRYQQDHGSHSSAEQQKDEVCRQAEFETAEAIMLLQQQLDAGKKSELLAKQSLDKLQLQNNELNDRLVEVMKQNEELSTHNSLLQFKLTRRDELSKALSFDLQESVSEAKDKAELIKVTKLMTSLEQELASKSLELDVAISDKEQLKTQILKSNEKAAALEEDLAKKFDELNILSMKNAELKSLLKRIKRMSCTMGELAHKSKVIGRHEEDPIEISFLDERNIDSGSWLNDLSKLLDEKQHSDVQILILKEKLDMAQALTEKFEAIATKAQQRAMLLERSVEDLEITICELENKVDIIQEEAKNQRVQLELELQNVRLQTVTSRRPRSSIRYIQNELLSADENTGRTITKEVSKKESEVLGPVQEGPTSSTIRCKHSMGMTSHIEELLPGSCASNVEPCADACSSSGISKDDADASNMHGLPHSTSQRKPNRYPAMEAFDRDQSKSEEQVQPPPVEPVIEVVEENELPPVAPKLSNDPVSYGGGGMDSNQSQSESNSEEQVTYPAVETVVGVVEENELPPVAQVQTDDHVNYMRAPSDELKRLRSRNPYEGKRTATDRRFWSIEQQDLYNSIYSKAKVAKKKWTGWKHVDSVEQFAGIRRRCAHLGLEQIMGYSCDWDNELIRQFYSTVYISADKTSMTWMADGRRITTNKRAWQERFGIPRGVHTDIHSQLFLNDDDKRIMYTAAECTLGHINGLSPLASIANKILRTTIYPRFGNTTHSWNVLYHVVEQRPFDIIGLIFGEIDLLISDHSRTKDPLLYAPYIMGMVMRAFEYRGPRESRHHSYKPRPHYKSKVYKKAHPPAAGATPAVVSPLEPSSLSAEAASTGHVAHVEAGDDQHQFEAAGHQPQVQVVQGRGVLIEPIRDSLAHMDGRIGRGEDWASVPAQHIHSCSSSQIPAPNSTVAPSLQTATARAPPQAPVTSLPSSGQPSEEHADTPAVSAQPVRVRPSPFSGFRWYQNK